MITENGESSSDKSCGKRKAENNVSLVENGTSIEMNTQQSRSTSIMRYATEIEKIKFFCDF